MYPNKTWRFNLQPNTEKRGVKSKLFETVASRLIKSRELINEYSFRETLYILTNLLSC